MWTFNGYTNFPRSGSIACGWFVQRILEHRDFTFIKKHSQRPYFAQNWPRMMIEGLSPWSWTFPDSTETSQTINDHIATLKEDLYLIGFANSSRDPGGHVGFLLTSTEGSYILHSLGKVECTRASENSYYRQSEFFYLGEVFNESIMICWLTGKPITW